MRRGYAIAFVLALSGALWLDALVTVQAHVTKCPPVACEPTDVQVTRVWTVRLKRADGARGRVQVNAADVLEAAQAGIAAGGGAEVTDVWNETLTLGEVSWE